MSTNHRVFVAGRAGLFGGLAVKCTCGEVLHGATSVVHSIGLAELTELDQNHTRERAAR